MRQGGGAEGNRTPDLLIANEALYQLSYSPAVLAAEKCQPDAVKSSRGKSSRRTCHQASPSLGRCRLCMVPLGSAAFPGNH